MENDLKNAKKQTMKRKKVVERAKMRPRSFKAKELEVDHH